MGNENKNRKTLLGVLASKFVDQKENLATEALLHIVNTSRESKDAFLDFLRQTSCNLKDNLTFKSQEQSDKDDSIPDMVGTNSNGDKLAIVENKFWAGLTENQPNTYLDQLPENGLLLFVAPSLRLPTVWAEIKRRAIVKGHELEQEKTISADLIETRAGKVILAVTSWRCLLNFLCTRMTTVGDLDTVSDIKQLMGLCDEQDSDAFIPLQSKDLSPCIAARNIDFSNIIVSAGDKLEELGLVEIKKFNLQASGGFGYYAKSMRNGKNYLTLKFDSINWINTFETPIWLQIQEIGEGRWWKRISNEQKDKLKKYESMNPCLLFKQNDGIFIPIILPIGKEENVVIDSVIKQVNDVLDLLVDNTSH